MDNAKIHHREEVKDLIASYGTFVCSIDEFYLRFHSGVRLVYLSPYSPDYNPIEEAFSKIKSFMQHESVYLLASANTAGIMFDMSLAMTIITADDAAGYFRHAGYF